MKKIPIDTAKDIAYDFDYDQVVVVARKVDGGEWVTSFGKSKASCLVAARMAQHIQAVVKKTTKGDTK